MIRLISVALAIVVAAALSGSIETEAGEPQTALADCAAPPSLRLIEPTLTHVAARIDKGERLTIVAVGSSSTQGVGASAPSLNYPSRLEAELRQRFPHIDIRVINRGKGGEDAPEELARMDRDVLAERPDLVIWQIGTNAVLRRDDLAADDESIRRGVAMVQQRASDVVLMDMQFAPRVIGRPAAATMQRLIAQAAERSHVGLFRRFEIMRHWQLQPEPAQMIGPDGLHMTDRGYACLAAELAEAIAGNWREHERSTQSARSSLVAGLARPGDSPGDLYANEDP